MLMFKLMSLIRCILCCDRWNLYRVGLNYNHGTGHGIGAYGFIHESPIQVMYCLNQMKLYYKPWYILMYEKDCLINFLNFVIGTGILKRGAQNGARLFLLR